MNKDVHLTSNISGKYEAEFQFKIKKTHNFMVFRKYVRK